MNNKYEIFETIFYPLNYADNTVSLRVYTFTTIKHN